MKRKFQHSIAKIVRERAKDTPYIDHAQFPLAASSHFWVSGLYWGWLWHAYRYAAPLQAPKVLDYQFKTGILGHMLARRGANVLAYNSDLRAFHALRSFVGFSDNLVPTEQASDIIGPYNLIIAKDVLQTEKDPQALLALFKKQLAPKGQVLFGLTRNNFGYRFAYVRSRSAIPKHHKSYKEALALLQQTGKTTLISHIMPWYPVHSLWAWQPNGQ